MNMLRCRTHLKFFWNQPGLTSFFNLNAMPFHCHSGRSVVAGSLFLPLNSFLKTFAFKLPFLLVTLHLELCFTGRSVFLIALHPLIRHGLLHTHCALRFPLLDLKKTTKMPKVRIYAVFFWLRVSEKD